MEPRGGWWTIDTQCLFPGLRPLRRQRLWLMRASRLLLEQLFQLLLPPLLLLPLKLLQLLLPALLQLLFEPLSMLQLWLLLLQLLLLLLLELPRLRLLRQSPLQAALLFLFFFFSRTPFLILFPPLLDRVEPDWPRHPFPNKRGLDLLARSTSIRRVRIATRPIANGNRVTHSTGLGWLGGSLLALGTRCLDPPR